MLYTRELLTWSTFFMWQKRSAQVTPSNAARASANQPYRMGKSPLAMCFSSCRIESQNHYARSLTMLHWPHRQVGGGFTRCQDTDESFIITPGWGPNKWCRGNYKASFQGVPWVLTLRKTLKDQSSQCRLRDSWPWNRDSSQFPMFLYKLQSSEIFRNLACNKNFQNGKEL